MACSNHPTKNNIRQIIDWRPVPSDKRYEEKIIIYKSNRTTRLTRLVDGPRSPENPEYHHYTEMYDDKGEKEISRTHYSTDEGEKGTHTSAHKTARAILDDLDEAISSLRSSR